MEYGGVRAHARLDTLPDAVAPGDYVLVHTGFAIRKLAADDAQQTLRLFDELARSLAEESPIADAGSRPGDPQGRGHR